MTASNVHELYPRIIGADGRRTTFSPAEVRRILKAEGWRQDDAGVWQPPVPKGRR